MRPVRVFRDPVHITMGLSREAPHERLALALIDTPEVQRLRHIRQLGLASFVYHGVEHSRFSHTLGVTHLARRFYSSALANSGEQLDEEEATSVMAAAVLHDVGHAPFSHALEKSIGVDHESVSAAIVKGDTSVNKVLSSVGGEAFVKSVAAHITDSSDQRTVSIISSQLDADRADYVLRDGYHAGVPNSQYDLERILQMVQLDEHGLLFDVRAKQAIEGYFIARYHLYLQLYYHRTVRSAEAMLRAIFQRARRLRMDGTSLGTIGILDSLFKEDPSIDVAATVTDHEMWSAFRCWAEHPDPILSDLAKRLLERRLFKVSEIPTRDYFTFGAETLPKLKQISTNAGYEADYYVRIDSAKDSPYKVSDPAATGPDLNSIRLLNRDDSISSLETNSAVVKALQNEAYQLNRVCYPEEIKDELKAVLKY